MKKTSVYLTAAETEGLRRLAVREGRSQAELIREGVRRVLGESEAPRTFHSLGKGRGGGRRAEGWDPDDLYDWVKGER